MKYLDFKYSRTVANGDLYICPECGAEMFLEKNSPIVPYCDECDSEFDIDFEEGGNYDKS